MAPIGSHTRPVHGDCDDWITPRHIIEALGPFNLDPCAANPQPWPTASEMWSFPHQNGLAMPWQGRVWLNPPYGPQVRLWLRKLRWHGNGIALVFARTDTTWFEDEIWPWCDALMFLHGRLHFHYPDGRRAGGNSGGPSVLIAYGENNLQALRQADLAGTLVIPERKRPA